MRTQHFILVGAPSSTAHTQYALPVMYRISHGGIIRYQGGGVFSGLQRCLRGFKGPRGENVYLDVQGNRNPPKIWHFGVFIGV